MAIYFGLGSNLGDRKENLRQAINLLEQNGIHCLQASPVIETPALLPVDAPWEWNKPYLNMAIEVGTQVNCDAALEIIKAIQTELERDNSERWSPRPIDIDILLWNDQTINTESLIIPHKDLHLRHFVLTPLIALAPNLTIPGRGNKTLMQWSMELPHHMPLWMGILNATPDSFSDGGKNAGHTELMQSAQDMTDHGAAILDIGGESTRPGAEHINPDDEWQRIGRFIEEMTSTHKTNPARPWISVDTRHAQTAAKAIDCGVDFINDVGGLSDPAMLELAADSNCEWIAMHSVSVPADPDQLITGDPITVIEKWLEQKLTQWSKAGVPLDKIIIDPGVGFGKDPLQSLKLLQSAAQLRTHGVRLLIGHSRKSYLKPFVSTDIHARDLATIGASLQLCQQGVDIIRVHNIKDHIAAYRGWSHLN